MQSIPIIHTTQLPNELKLERYRRTPDLGPKILFFTGGSALKELSQNIIQYTHNSVHLVTSFDSGGSSAKIREAFNMISVGDLRNRLMALADQSLLGNPVIYKLFAYRLPEDENQDFLRHRLNQMICGQDPLIKAISVPMRTIIRNHLAFFQKAMPTDFDLKGASIGNLILAGGWINQDYDIDPVLFMFSRLIKARGTVLPIVIDNLHLAAKLENGEVIYRQHNMTGKETAPLNSAVRELFLVDVEGQPKSAQIADKISREILDAELVCYPIGSFYTSVLCNLLVDGVAECLYKNPCPKVFVLNAGVDPEMVGRSLNDSIRLLVEHLMGRVAHSQAKDFLNFVLVDQNVFKQDASIDENYWRKRGVRILCADLMDSKTSKRYIPQKLNDILLSLT